MNSSASQYTPRGLLRVLLAGVMCLSAGWVVAQSSLIKADYPDEYIVQEGDTLWDIASQFLQDPQRWQEVWVPDEHLDDADLIYPGDKLYLSFVGGSPRILLQRGDRTEVRLVPQIREEALSSAIPAIPLEAIENSFTRNRIVDRSLYDAAPYIVTNLGPNLAIGTGDEVHARGVWPLGTSSFEIYRPGRVFTDDETDDELGLELIYLGFATILQEESADLRRLLINNGAREIRVGDRLLVREESSIGATIFPTEPVADLEGRIIAFGSNETMASQLDTVIVNLGARDNLVIGDILSIRHEDERIVDDVEVGRMTFRERLSHLFSPRRVELPGADIGTLLVYRTFETISYAVILESIEPAVLGNRVSSP